MGSTLPESIQTVALEVINQTDEPSIEVAVMKALRAEIQMDGRLEVRPADEADALLSVTLTSYRLTALAYDRRRGALAREYRVSMSGRAVLSCSETEEVILQTPGVTGESDFPFVSDLTTAKLDAAPHAATDFARKVISLTVMPW